MMGEMGGVIPRAGESELPSDGWYVGDGYGTGQWVSTSLRNRYRCRRDLETLAEGDMTLPVEEFGAPIAFAGSNRKSNAYQRYAGAPNSKPHREGQ